MKKLAMALGLLMMLVGFSGGVARADELPMPTFTVTPASHDFGSVPVNALASADLVVTNTGVGSITIVSVKTKAPYSCGATSFTLAPGQSRRVSVAFAPRAAGQYNTTCSFVSNIPSVYVNVPLSGTGVE